MADWNGVRMVVVESDLLPPDGAVVVIPLIAGYPAVRFLNPVLRVDGEAMVLATRLIGSVRRAALRRVGTVREQADLVTRAVDVLLSGV